MRRRILALPLIVAACTPTPPPRAPAPAPVAAATRATPPLAPPTDWRDRAYTPGTWTYADHVATYGPAGSPALVTLRCDLAQKRVLLSVAGSMPTLTIRTSYGERDWPAQIGTDGRSTISFAATDAALDQIAFSRGRFSIANPGLAEIDIPAWAEPARVIEDCRP